MSFEIDPVKYGQLWQSVDDLKAKVDKLEEGMETLLALAHRSQGGLWTGMAIVSALSTFIGFISHYFTSK
jgi:cytochrome c556